MTLIYSHHTFSITLLIQVNYLFQCGSNGLELISGKIRNQSATIRVYQDDDHQEPDTTRQAECQTGHFPSFQTTALFL